MELEGHATETQKQISEELDKLLLALVTESRITVDAKGQPIRLRPATARSTAPHARPPNRSSQSGQITSARPLANTLNLASPACPSGRRPQARIMGGAISRR